MDPRLPRSLGPSAVALLAFLLLAALAIPAAWTGPAFALLVGLAPAAFLGLARRRRRERRAGAWLATSVVAALTLVGGGFAVLVAARHRDPLEPWLWGLPWAIGVQVWVLAVAPLLVLGGLFGFGFARWRPTAEDLDRLAALARDHPASGAEADE